MATNLMEVGEVTMKYVDTIGEHDTKCSDLIGKLSKNSANTGAKEQIPTKLKESAHRIW
jgi:hypothetical protein